MDAGALPLDAHASVPQHVVYRRFAAETVVLNLETGTYHGLNATGARMLELNPMLPIGSGLTVNVAVESYVDGLSVGICCDPEAVPDSDELTAGIAGSLDTLLGRADRLSG